MLNWLCKHFIHGVIGKCTFAITKSLQGRFKEFRRPFKPKKSTTSSSKPKEQSGLKGHSILSTIPVPDGEDSLSFERHIEHGFSSWWSCGFRYVTSTLSAVKDCLSYDFSVYYAGLNTLLWKSLNSCIICVAFIWKPISCTTILINFNLGYLMYYLITVNQSHARNLKQYF